MSTTAATWRFTSAERQLLPPPLPPGDPIWPRDVWEDERARKRRVRFGAYFDEVIPLDFVSWRVLLHMVSDRGQREHYASSFPIIAEWTRIARREAEADRPFVDRVLQRLGVNPALPEAEEKRARVERLCRWWRLKTKTHRTIGEDDAKALRMIEAAARRNDDSDDDPERELFQALREGR